MVSGTDADFMPIATTQRTKESTRKKSGSEQSHSEFQFYQRASLGNAKKADRDTPVRFLYRERTKCELIR